MTVSAREAEDFFRDHDLGVEAGLGVQPDADDAKCSGGRPQNLLPNFQAPFGNLNTASPRQLDRLSPASYRKTET